MPPMRPMRRQAPVGWRRMPPARARPARARPARATPVAALQARPMLRLARRPWRRPARPTVRTVWLARRPWRPLARPLSPAPRWLPLQMPSLQMLSLQMQLRPPAEEMVQGLPARRSGQGWGRPGASDRPGATAQVPRTGRRLRRPPVPRTGLALTWTDRLLCEEHCGRHPVDDLGEPWGETLPTIGDAHEALKPQISEHSVPAQDFCRDSSDPPDPATPESPGTPTGGPISCRRRIRCDRRSRPIRSPP
jgi:hypothetical protein